jgi:glycosyltransferase involved in cell wall biosynthesis
MNPYSITFVTSGLKTGGAEMMLLKLLGSINRELFAPRIVSLAGKGELAHRFTSLGIPIETSESISGLPRVLWKQKPPSLIIGWMYHGNIAASCMQFFLKIRQHGAPPLLFKTTHTPADLSTYKRATRWSISLGALLSKRVEKVLYCAESSQKAHEALGYDPSRSYTLVDGFNSASFFPLPTMREEIRSELGIPSSAPLIGTISRFHPHKGIPNTLGAFARLASLHPTLHLLMIGNGLEAANKELRACSDGLGLPYDRLHLLGRKENIPRYLQALDILINGSEREAFPNVIGEALLCGIPCVATDVGDTQVLVGQCGKVVPPNSSEKLSDGVSAILSLTHEARLKLGEEGRSRIKQRYELSHIVKEYERLFEEIIINHHVTKAT